MVSRQFEPLKMCAFSYSDQSLLIKIIPQKPLKLFLIALQNSPEGMLVQLMDVLTC